MRTSSNFLLRALAVLAALPCTAYASALHLPVLATGLSSGTGTLALLLQWLFGG